MKSKNFHARFASRFAQSELLSCLVLIPTLASSTETWLRPLVIREYLSAYALIRSRGRSIRSLPRDRIALQTAFSYIFNGVIHFRKEGGAQHC